MKELVDSFIYNFIGCDGRRRTMFVRALLEHPPLLQSPIKMSLTEVDHHNYKCKVQCTWVLAQYCLFFFRFWCIIRLNAVVKSNFVICFINVLVEWWCIIIIVFNNLEVKIIREGQGPQSGLETVPGRARVLGREGTRTPIGGNSLLEEIPFQEGLQVEWIPGRTGFWFRETVLGIGPVSSLLLQGLTSVCNQAYQSSQKYLWSLLHMVCHGWHSKCHK